MKSIIPQLLRICAVILVIFSTLHARSVDRLAKEFATPPDSARPWVYWFWLNGNITKEGITADLEAMRRVGIRGVLIMEVDQGAPVGPVDFMSTRWRELFKHVHQEAQRLGLEVNMNNDAGWNGSGGPWIKPEQSMQKVVWSETNVTGPQKFEATLSIPEHNANFYRDISVLAFPKTGAYRIPNIRAKAAFEMGNTSLSEPTNLTAEMLIDRKLIRNVTGSMDQTGRFSCDLPQGEWTIVRFGHTTTGAENAPAPKTGRGLECDKLSASGIEANFNGMMAALVKDNCAARQNQANGLVATHIDSWENGSQNWTAAMREEFRRRRGYDLESLLPVITGRVVDSLDVSERFLWDLRKTVSELVIENYSGRMKQLAHQGGLRYTVEAYGSPCDFLPYAGQSDEPMGEFWVPSGAMETCKGMACAAHIYGKRIVGAEAFTADDHERWLQHPGSLKALGDRAFCEGINRFVFHRYALQPWVPERQPGMMMGPWGEHYERTQTWWEQTSAWHDYLARCQLLLREGLFVADICYLQAEAPPQGFGAHSRSGYDWDECPGELLKAEMKAASNRLQLPGGMSYRVLVLPSTSSMTPELLKAARDLARAGATVIGNPPQKSPSLSRYPEADNELKQVAAELWGDCDGTKIKQRRYGQGLIVRGIEPEAFLQSAGVAPDFQGDRRLHYIHRQTGSADIYFVASSAKSSLDTVVAFRVTGKMPELWHPETGLLERAPVFHEANGSTRVGLHLPVAGSVFVVFREKLKSSDDVIAKLRRNSEPVVDCVQPQARARTARMTVEKARYGVLNDRARTRDVRDKLQKLLDAGETSVRVARMAEGDDPAFLVVKTLEVDYSVEGKQMHTSGTDPEEIDFEPPETQPRRVAALQLSFLGKPTLEAWEPGQFEASTGSGRILKCEASDIPTSLELSGPWQLRLESGPDKGATIGLEKLASWAESQDPKLKYFSGSAVYLKRFEIPATMLKNNQRIYLELGDVQVIAEVTLNRRRLPLLWKSPFTVDISSAAKPGENHLEVKVVNLWPNRLIGDEQLPEDSERNPDGTLKSWPQWLLDGKPSPAGRSTFVSWRLWKQGDPLLSSGLIGPVRLRCSKLVDLK